MSSGSIVVVERLVKSFPTSGGSRSRANFRAVDDVSFALGVGEALGLVGETGAGKSTIARCVLGLESPTAGRVELFGANLVDLSARGWREIRRQIQPVFQDPKGAMNPRWTVEQLVREPMIRLSGLSVKEANARVRVALSSVGLGDEFLSRYRHQLSGGQQQRVNIARAIAVEPRCVVLDEPVAALDSSVKREVVRLLDDLRRTRDLAYLLISHDLNVVRILCQTTIVLFRGRIVEMGPTGMLMSDPRHPYTRRLLDAQLRGRGGGASAAALPDDRDGWSPDSDQPAPQVGDLVEVQPGHLVARIP